MDPASHAGSIPQTAPSVPCFGPSSRKDFARQERAPALPPPWRNPGPSFGSRLGSVPSLDLGFPHL